MLRTSLLATAAVSLLLTGCPRDSVQSSKSKVRTSSSPVAKRLLASVPASAALVGLIDGDRSFWNTANDYMFIALTPEEQKALDDDMFGYIQQLTKLDPRNLQAGVVFMTVTGERPSGAVMLSPMSGTLAGPSTDHGAHKLFNIAPEMVAAMHGDQLIVGDAAGVKSALDVIDGKGKALIGSTSPIAKDVSGQFVGANMGVVVGQELLEFFPMLAPYRVEKAALSARGASVELTVTGGNLGPLAQMVNDRASELVGEIAREKNEAKAQHDLPEAVTMIWLHHMVKALVTRAKPTLAGNTMTMKLDTTMSGEVTGLIMATMATGAAVAIPAFGRYANKSKTTEAKEFVKKIYDGARAYYMDGGVRRGSMTPVAIQFPTSTAMTPPAGSCCKNPGGKCEPSAHQWSTPAWVALSFSVDDPHYYSYQYIQNADGQGFTARAIGDLDCDGVYSTFEMYGTVNAEHPDGPSGSASIYKENELE